MKTTISILFLAALLTGCATKGNKFPEPIKDICSAALYDARDRVKSVDGVDRKETRCVVSLMKGQERLANRWCWQTSDGWISGTCSGSVITIGCNPNDPSDIHYETLVHEMGHHWLGVNEGQHPDEYAGVFDMW